MNRRHLSAGDMTRSATAMSAKAHNSKVNFTTRFRGADAQANGIGRHATDSGAPSHFEVPSYPFNLSLMALAGANVSFFEAAI